MHFVKNVLFSNKRQWFQSSWFIPKFKQKQIRISKTYAINPSYFEPLKESQNIVIKWPKIIDKRLIFPAGTCFFLFDAGVELKLIEKDSYLAGCKKLIADCDKKNCYVKFHPYQSNEMKNIILSYFDEFGIKYTEFTIDVPFELVISSNIGLEMYGFHTSLISFAEDINNNHIIYNYTSYLCKLSKSFNDYMSNYS